MTDNLSLDVLLQIHPAGQTELDFLMALQEKDETGVRDKLDADPGLAKHPLALAVAVLSCPSACGALLRAGACPNGSAGGYRSSGQSLRVTCFETIPLALAVLFDQWNVARTLINAGATPLLHIALPGTGTNYSFIEMLVEDENHAALMALERINPYMLRGLPAASTRAILLAAIRSSTAVLICIMHAMERSVVESYAGELFEMSVNQADSPLDVVTVLLAFGLDPNARGREAGVRPLHYATYFENHCLMALLLRNGADPNAAGDDGYTAAHLAAENNDEEGLAMLDSAGGRLDMELNDGCLPEDLASDGRIAIAIWQARLSGVSSSEDQINYSFIYPE